MVQNSRIAIAPRNDTEAYVCWDISPQQRQDIHKHDTQLTLFICDVTDCDMADYSLPWTTSPDRKGEDGEEYTADILKIQSMVHDAHWVQSYPCQEHTHDCYVSIPALYRDYVAELGYMNQQGEWSLITQSLPLRMYPIQSS